MCKPKNCFLSQVEVEQAERQFEQTHMVEWLERQVTEAMKTKQVSDSLVNCSANSNFLLNLVPCPFSLELPAAGEQAIWNVAFYCTVIVRFFLAFLFILGRVC